jgi:hypothetical protein
MNIKERIKALSAWGELILWLGQSNKGLKTCPIDIEPNRVTTIQDTIQTEVQFNPWFTEENVRKALDSLGTMLSFQALQKWVEAYPELQQKASSKKVGIVMAGNIPLVGMHDLICVLVSGHIACVKPSGSDNRLLPLLVEALEQIEPRFRNSVSWVNGTLDSYNAVIATGSNNTSRYFEHYFKHVPHIIRKNRSGIAILTGQETEKELKALGRDVFDYFGLGCRNVAKLFLPKGFDTDRLFGAWVDFSPIINHHKYANNYDYYRAVNLLNQEAILDNGFLLLKHTHELYSPLGTLNYEFYSNTSNLASRIKQYQDSIQCIMGKNNLPFGTSQQPQLWDYADGVDTLQFLISLN